MTLCLYLFERSMRLLQTNIAKDSQRSEKDMNNLLTHDNEDRTINVLKSQYHGTVFGSGKIMIQATHLVQIGLRLQTIIRVVLAPLHDEIRQSGDKGHNNSQEASVQLPQSGLSRGKFLAQPSHFVLERHGRACGKSASSQAEFQPFHTA